MGEGPVPEGLPAYCDAAVPVPVDQAFTYSLPRGLAAKVRPGCRVVVPFGHRTLSGVVLRTHHDTPDFEVRPISRVLDEVPSLTTELLRLAHWVAGYYSTPIGEVAKAMLPANNQLRYKKVVSLTRRGRRELDSVMMPVGIAMEVLASLSKRALTWTYLLQKHRGAAKALRQMQALGLVTVEKKLVSADPTNSRSALLMVEASGAGLAPEKPSAGERWLLDYLARHPGRHDVRALAVERSDAVRMARRLAKCGAVSLEAVVELGRVEREQDRFQLTQSQQTALDAIDRIVSAVRFKTLLLHGVTGSGKTEVYLRAIERVLERGRSALYMVPEIALTPALASQFFTRFQGRTALLHSGLSPTQRAEQWRAIRSGQAKVVLGTRSAVFAPLSDLGLVVVDEEHDGSYKQSEPAPRYNGRDVAIVRARSAKAAVVIGSATPGLETRWNAETGKYELLTMPHRINQRPLPKVDKVDMRREFSETGQVRLFSRAIVKAVQQCLARREQAIILLNRRGYSTHVLCRSCGERVECENCSVTLTYHKREKHLQCHYCDYSRPIPRRCDACGKQYMHFHGSGSEKVEDELRRCFPEASIARLDRDTVKAKDAFETILSAFRAGDYNLLVGTQMIAKGHDIPNVTLVCVIDADVGLGLPDFRAAERTFQLLTQVAGRAGRGEKPGRVLMQTMNPDHYAIDLAAGHDYDAFYRRELNFRKALWYPPFTSVATILVRSSDLSRAMAMTSALDQHLRPPPKGLRLIGPASAPVVKVRTEYRFQFLIKALDRRAVGQLLGQARGLALQQEWPPTALTVDVDPTDFL